MAIFLQGDLLPAVLWDAKLKREKFAFSKKRLETNSKVLIKMLVDLGYEMSEDKEENIKKEVEIVTTLDGNEIGETTTSSGGNKRIRLKGKDKK